MKRRELISLLENLAVFLSDTAGLMTGTRIQLYMFRSLFLGMPKSMNTLRVQS